VQRALGEGAARALRVLCEERVEPTVAAADTRRMRAALASAPFAAIEPLVDCLALLLAYKGIPTPHLQRLLGRSSSLHPTLAQLPCCCHVFSSCVG
jgi:hypothetical protein